MVRILANGDIVPDDDPRARQTTNRSTRSPQAQTGNIHQQFHGHNQEPGQQVSIFHSLNLRLLGYGIPRWNIGQTVIEPIVSVGFLLALMLFGLPGVLFGGVIFAVSKWSQNGPPGFLSRFLGNNPSSGRRDGDGSSRGYVGGGGGRNNNGGHRLGHS